MSGVIFEQLILKFKTKEASIAILGLGYVGLPLALRFSEAGYKVIGIDVDSKRVGLLNEGKSYLRHISGQEIATAKEKKFHASEKFSDVEKADAIIICVPTPLNSYREPDLSFVINTIESIQPYLGKGQILSLESTTYPGTTDEELLPRVTERGFTVGEDFFLVFSPEREDPGNPIYNTKNIPKVCGGYTPNCLKVGVALYEGAIDQVVPVSSTRAAELTKLLENIHRSVNIGLVNEMKIIADKMNIDIHEVIKAAATKPFGFTAYFPGPGLGGHCIPVDPFYLTWKARQFGLHTRFIELAGEINRDMPRWVVSKIASALNDKSKAVKGSKIFVLGLAYKKDVEDIRESPSIELIKKLMGKGALVSYCDPFVPVFPRDKEHDFDLKSIELNADNLKQFDLVLIATNHTVFDYNLIKNNSSIIVDTRGVYPASTENVVKA